MHKNLFDDFTKILQFVNEISGSVWYNGVSSEKMPSTRRPISLEVNMNESLVETQLIGKDEAISLATHARVSACVVSPLELVLVTPSNAAFELESPNWHDVNDILMSIITNKSEDVDVQILEPTWLCSGASSFFRTSIWIESPSSVKQQEDGEVVFLFDGQPIKSLVVSPDLYGFDATGVAALWDGFSKPSKSPWKSERL